MRSSPPGAMSRSVVSRPILQLLETFLFSFARVDIRVVYTESPVRRREAFLKTFDLTATSMVPVTLVAGVYGIQGCDGISARRAGEKRKKKKAPSWPGLPLLKEQCNMHERGAWPGPITRVALALGLSHIWAGVPRCPTWPLSLGTLW